MSRFRALAADHPLVRDATICQACHEPFVEGQVTALVMLGPGSDPEERTRRDEGRPYNAIALPIHFDCAATEYQR